MNREDHNDCESLSRNVEAMWNVRLPFSEGMSGFSDST